MICYCNGILILEASVKNEDTVADQLFIEWLDLMKSLSRIKDVTRPENLA